MEMPTLSNGRYRIDRFIGQGGMAGVFLAFDNNLKVERAVKLLHPEFITNTKVRERFINEALAMAQIRHPNVVQIFDQGEDGPSLFLVMEYYPLGSLERVLSARSLTIQETLWVMKKVSSGLAEAHGKGYLHRDIKPENMLLSEKGVHLADFGLVQIPDANQTHTKAVMGTLAYMPPEQRISAKRVVPQSDIYALTASLYCMLTQDLPDELFDDEERAEKIQSLPADIQDFIAKGCTANVEDRLDGVEAFQQGIEALIQVYGEQPLDISVLSQHSEVDQHHLIQLWSEYTSDSTEKEDVHAKETLIWEEEPSNPIQSSETSLEPQPKIEEPQTVNATVSTSEVLAEPTPNGNVGNSIVKAIATSLKWIMASFGVYVLISVGVVIYFSQQQGEGKIGWTLTEAELLDLLDEVSDPVPTSRLESIVLPPSQIEYYSLEDHLIAVVNETDDDGSGSRRVFWGPNFTNETVAEWGRKSFKTDIEIDWTQGKHLFELPRKGASRNGDNWDVYFVDSRYDAPAQRSVKRKESGQITLQCEETQYIFTSVEAPSEVHWYESSLDRRVKLLAKDLQFNYFYIDQLRYNEETPDYRFFKGTKGNMRLMDVIDASIQYDEIHILTTDGVFKMKGDEGIWTQNPIEKNTSTSLENMNIPQNARFIYTELGAYPTNLLGTPCDIQWLGSK